MESTQLYELEFHLPRFEVILIPAEALSLGPLFLPWDQLQMSQIACHWSAVERSESGLDIF